LTQHVRATISRLSVAAIAAVALAAGLLVALPAPAHAAVPVPAAPAGLPAAIEANPPYQPAVSCDYTVKPGLAKFEALVEKTYPGTGSSGILNTCAAEGTVSEHTEGRAWDWTVSVTNPATHADADALRAWLTANEGANARRLGIMYIIWNAQIWGAYSPDAGWKPYACTGVTACHKDHMHFSFTWNGAWGRTSWWTGKVYPTDYGPCVAPGRTFAPPASQTPNLTRCPGGNLAATDPLVVGMKQNVHTVLRQGATGAAVALVQSVLGGLAVDGRFGTSTTDLLTSFQIRHGLGDHGVVDAATWNALITQAVGTPAVAPTKKPPSRVEIRRALHL
jgi:hypothetical protein